MSAAALRRALVTGGAGFLGSHLVEALLAEGWAVRVVDDFSSGRPQNLATARDRIELVRGDFSQPETAARAVADTTVVFHLGALASVPASLADPLRSHRVNVDGTLQLLEAARRARVSRFVYAGSAAVYGDGGPLPKTEDLPAAPASPYGLQKHAGELYCRLYHELFGLETVVLRYFNVFGPRQDPHGDAGAVVPRFAAACLRGEAPTVDGDGEQSRDFVYVADVVRANLAAASSAKAPGRAINVAGGRRTSLNQLLAAIQRVVGGVVAPRHGPARPGDLRHSVADLGRARDLLGWQPEVSLEAGLRTTIEHLDAETRGRR